MDGELMRCAWAGTDALLVQYHDKEWGVPLHDDQKLFEFLILEGAQAGLSWLTILKKREGYRAAFDDFDAEKIAGYDETKIAALLENAGIIRNRLKIRSTVQNAEAFLAVQQEFGTFDKYVRQFAVRETTQHQTRNVTGLPTQTPQSDALSKGLRQRGFKFVGSTICYAFMQATGIVNDHLVGCFRYREIGNVQSM